MAQEIRTFIFGSDSWKGRRHRTDDQYDLVYNPLISFEVPKN
jgi:hypothetical protein